MKKPILVTGSHRSGTTWVGKMISLSRQVGYISGPFNIGLAPGYNMLNLDYWFNYINCNNDNEEKLKNELNNILSFNYQFFQEMHRLNNFRDFLRTCRELSRSLIKKIYNRRPLMKDPIAIMSVEWLYKTKLLIWILLF